MTLNPVNPAGIDDQKLAAARLSNNPTDGAIIARPDQRDSTTMWRVVDPLDPTNTGAPVLLGKTYVLQDIANGDGLGFCYQPGAEGGFYVPVSGAPSDQRTWCRFL